jgi:leishmanolysin-like peptidase
MPPALARHQHHDHHHHCNHDSAAFAVEDSTRTPQPYPDSHPHRRGLSSGAGGGWNASALWEPLRINHTVTAMDNLTAAQESFLVDQLLPAAMSWVGSALRVVRSTGPLLARRTCFQQWPSNGVCGLETTSYCGVASDDYRVTIPQWALGGMTVCTSSPSSGCSTSADGGGYPDADFVLYVTAGESKICTGAVLAYASTCVRDQFDRPVFGHANFCPSKLDTTPSAMEEQLSTAVHEVRHLVATPSPSYHPSAMEEQLSTAVHDTRRAMRHLAATPSPRYHPPLSPCRCSMPWASPPPPGP